MAAKNPKLASGTWAETDHARESGVYGKEKTVPSSLITYVRKAYRFTEAKEERDEVEKDIWTLENLDIAIKRIRLKMCRL